jgi:hypothetical protein
MNATMMMKWMLAAAVTSASPALAQSTLGGAKPQQNKIGGVAKPAPVVGGAVIHTPSPPTPPKPGAVVNTVKPVSPGVTTPGMTSNAALNQPPGPRPNPPVAPKPAGPVVTSNLKCASGACTSRGPKP